MTSHEAVSSAAGGSMIGGVTGLFLAYIQLPSAAVVSNLMSLAGIVVAGIILIWQHITKAKRQEHNSSVASENIEIKLLMQRNADSLSEIARLTEQNIELQHKMLERQSGCPVSGEVLRQLKESGKSVLVKDEHNAKEAAC